MERCVGAGSCKTCSESVVPECPSRYRRKSCLIHASCPPSISLCLHVHVCIGPLLFFSLTTRTLAMDPLRNAIGDNLASLAFNKSRTMSTTVPESSLFPMCYHVPPKPVPNPILILKALVLIGSHLRLVPLALALHGALVLPGPLAGELQARRVFFVGVQAL